MKRHVHKNQPEHPHPSHPTALISVRIVLTVAVSNIRISCVLDEDKTNLVYAVNRIKKSPASINQPLSTWLDWWCVIYINRKSKKDTSKGPTSNEWLPFGSMRFWHYPCSQSLKKYVLYVCQEWVNESNNEGSGKWTQEITHLPT